MNKFVHVMCVDDEERELWKSRQAHTESMVCPTRVP